MYLIKNKQNYEIEHMYVWITSKRKKKKKKSTKRDSYLMNGKSQN